ncbi:SHUGOSHIN 2 isoform X2 [Jatropha curcas]|nr:SHUGOSHIN 2 isoform X2 [Jatropha curcas]XP_037494200.1 SHUGOSHIN 2 isoform X2 [Jatropha curcas]
MPRKKLADISNLPMQNQDMRLQSASLNTKEYIHKLHQENLSLVKLVADRNKIIQLHAFEFQKLRTECQQVQQRNLQLAQTNSQMLAELNACKDRLKVLQHELGCKNGLLKAWKLESEDEANTVKCQIYGSEVETVKHEEDGELSQADNRGDEPCNKKRKKKSKSTDPTHVQAKEKIVKKRRKSANWKQDPTDDVFESHALGPATVKPVLAENNIDNKRHCLRRQSPRFKAGEQESKSDILGTSDSVDPTIESVQNEKKVDSKRCCSRRQSARLKAGEQEPKNDAFEISDVLGPTIVEPVQIEKKVDSKSCCSRRQSARFKAGEQEPKNDLVETSDPPGPSTVEPLQTEREVDSKRLCLRRQSARLKCREQIQEPAIDLVLKDDAKFSVSPLHECGPTASLSSLKVESEAVPTAPGSEAQELGRPSIRPKRQAAEKIQTYKEIPLNIKMRRTE